MRLLLFSFGKLKTPGLRESAEYYCRLIQPWVELEEIELKPLSVPDKSPATRRKIQEQEGQLLLEKISKAISGRGRIYLLDEAGKSQPTSAWAELAQKWESESIPEVAICIGSSLGFSEELRSKVHGKLALGPQTLSHELARVVLLEQLYRAWSVIRGHPYHNEGM